MSDDNMFPNLMAASEISVTDIPRALFFYTEALGMEVFSDDKHSAIVGNSNFRILLKKRLTAGDVSGFCFGSNDIQSLYEVMKKENITINKQMFDGPFGKEFIFEDPDGNILRVVENQKM